MFKILTQFIDLIYENSCLICSDASKEFIVCKKCESSFTERKENYTKQFEEITVFSYWFYDGKLRDGILSLKSGKKKLANYFGENLVSFFNKIRKEINEDLLVISVPSHKKRIKERGYCQSTLIGKELAKSIGKDFEDNFIKREKETKYMNSLESLADRVINITDAFKIIGQKPKEKNILIVDDILTSGSTMCEIARTIHKKYPDVNLIGLTVASGDTYQ